MTEKPVRLVRAGMPSPIKVTLNEGDQIEVGVSADVKIDGDGTWITFKAKSQVGAGETGAEAHERVLSYVQECFEMTVNSVVTQVRRMGE
jgi:hypothetical protein